MPRSTATARKNNNIQEYPAALRGRPRSEKSRKAIINATNKLLLRNSVQQLSIEAIARKARVGKTTIYRWWPNKTAIVMDALMSEPGMNTPLPTANDNADAIRLLLDKLLRVLQGKHGRVISQLFTESQMDEKAREAMDESFLGPLIDAVSYSVEEGQKNGEFRSDIPLNMAVDMLCGPIIFRMLSRPEDITPTFQRDYPVKVIELLKA